MTRFRHAGDERGSLPVAIIITTLGLVLSAALLPLVVRQVTFTRDFQDRSAALNGAQIGLDMVMARVRAASEISSTSGIVDGRLEDMPPCTFTGDAGVPGTGEKMLYNVTIEYYNQAGEWLNKDCAPLTEVPTTAKVTSVGASKSEIREVSATYKFSTKNNNIPGGSIWIASPANTTLCLDATVRPPAEGAAVVMRRCNGSSTQQFAYTEELYLKLINSEGAKLSGGKIADNGMCLFSPVTTTVPSLHTPGTSVVFRACPTTDKPTAIFQWSLDGASQFRSTNSAQAIEGLCLTLQHANTVGTGLVLNTCAYDNSLSVWRSDPKIGAGMAGDKTNQLVNFAQFSRCLDVTSQKTSSSYMIAWFCKQSPNGVVDWNQIWEHPIPNATKKEISKKGPIVVTRSNVKYCLKSPLSTASTEYVKVEECPAGYATTYAAASDKSAYGWTVYHNTGSYASSYRIIDNKGFCLQPTDLNAATKDTHSDGTSKVKVATCNSSELQKWNAPPNLSVATPITDVKEK